MSCRMRRYEQDAAIYEPLTLNQRAELDALAALPEEAVDTSDIPELQEEFWKNAAPGNFYRPE